MPSFDIVCQSDLQEVDNAVNQASREIQNRFDFRGGKSSLKLLKDQKKIEILADDEMKLRSIHQILETKFAKRSLDCRLLKYNDFEQGSSQLLKQSIDLQDGLSKENAKKITKMIKESKLKVQSQIQDEQVRVSGKKIDDLQEVMRVVKESDLGLPVQFINMRN